MIEELRSLWDLLWYGGIALGQLFLIVAIMRGALVPRIHHEYVKQELTKDRNEWQADSQEKQVIITRLSEALALKRTRG